MIIDSHAHLVAPDSFYGLWTMLEAAGTFHGRIPSKTGEEDLLASARRQNLQTEVATNSVLKMNHIIALLQIGEVNFQQRTSRLRVA